MKFLKIPANGDGELINIKEEKDITAEECISEANSRETEESRVEESCVTSVTNKDEADDLEVQSPKTSRRGKCLASIITPVLLNLVLGPYLKCFPGNSKSTVKKNKGVLQQDGTTTRTLRRTTRSTRRFDSYRNSTFFW